MQGGELNSSLSEKGIEQAKQLGRSLQLHRIHVELIVSSGLDRSKQTALEICGQMKPRSHVAHSTMMGFGEMKYGELEGLPLKSVGQELQDLMASWAKGNTGVSVGGVRGESPDHVWVRGLDAFKQVLNQRRQNTVIVAHGNFNKIVLSILTGIGIGRMFEIKQDNACVNVIDIDLHTFERDHSSAHVVALNINDHLLQDQHDQPSNL